MLPEEKVAIFIAYTAKNIRDRYRSDYDTGIEIRADTWHWGNIAIRDWILLRYIVVACYGCDIWSDTGHIYCPNVTNQDKTIRYVSVRYFWPCTLATWDRFCNHTLPGMRTTQCIQEIYIIQYNEMLLYKRIAMLSDATVQTALSRVWHTITDGKDQLSWKGF